MRLIGQLFIKITTLLQNETKLRSLQSRLNLRSIVTNVQLYVLNIASNNLCTFYCEEPKTLIHLFCDCKIVDTFWNDVFDWILARFCINTHLNLHFLSAFSCLGVATAGNLHFVIWHFCFCGRMPFLPPTLSS